MLCNTGAECIIMTEHYYYFGNRSETLPGYGSKPCENWAVVMDYHKKLFHGFNQYFFADEYGQHSYCRQIKLDAYRRHPNTSKASAHHYVHTDGWKHGPWCYVKMGKNNPTTLWNEQFESMYKPVPCFSQCKGIGVWLNERPAGSSCDQLPKFRTTASTKVATTEDSE
ncbi:hypothetical protein Ddc_06524 [Ditylenchus destructor]|nr:hypothetical protein Ddc_06524 [Ditylenchus destructor]